MPPRFSLNTKLTLGVNAPLMEFTSNDEIWSNCSHHFFATTFCQLTTNDFGRKNGVNLTNFSTNLKKFVSFFKAQIQTKKMRELLEFENPFSKANCWTKQLL